MKKILYILLNLQTLLTLQTVLAQPVTEEWVKRYNGPDNQSDGAVGIGVDSLNNIYVTGGILTNLESNNIATLKYSPAGVQQWVTIYNGPSEYSIDFVEDVIVDKAGSVYLTGSTLSGSLGSSTFLTIKYNTGGIQQWVKYYSGPGNNDAAFSIAVDKNGNVYVTGISPEVPSGSSIVTIKYRSNGEQLWVDRFHESGYWGNYVHSSKSISLDEIGNVYVGGGGRENHWLALPDLFTIKYDTSGNRCWVKRYGSLDTSEFYNKLTVSKNGNIYVSAVAYWYTTLTQAVLTIKYDSSGNQLWMQTYAYGLGHDYIPSVLKTDLENNVFIVGTGWSGSNSTSDFMTIKYDSAGSLIWVKYYLINDTGYTKGVGKDIIVDDSANVYVTGEVKGQYVPSKYITIKYDKNGNMKWTMNYSGVGKKLSIDNLRNIYVVGDNSDSTTGTDYITIKYSQVVGVKSISTHVPYEFNLYQNYPNPFNPITKIKFDIPSFNQRNMFEVRLIIYDILGKEVSKLVNEQLKSGSYEVEWNAVEYSSGTYFYVFAVDNRIIETKKMILKK